MLKVALIISNILGEVLLMLPLITITGGGASATSKVRFDVPMITLNVEFTFRL